MRYCIKIYDRKKQENVYTEEGEVKNSVDNVNMRIRFWNAVEKHDLSSGTCYLFEKRDNGSIKISSGDLQALKRCHDTYTTKHLGEGWVEVKFGKTPLDSIVLRESHLELIKDL